ncbi:hypothetical protein JCM10449v2_006504 [Rhodotorula kratochvilovae]
MKNELSKSVENRLEQLSCGIWKDARERLDLPDATGGGFTEWQYAQLVFGKHCHECGVSNVRYADYGVRKRLCKRCREASIIRLDWKKINPTSFHLLLQNSPANVRWQGGALFGLVDDLRYFSSKLWDLEYVDNVSSGGDKADSSDDDDAPRAPALATLRGRRALAATFIEQAKKEGEAMYTAAMKLHRESQERKSNECGIPFSVWSSQMDCADEVMERVLELDLGYCESDFTSTFFKHELIYARGAADE